MPQAVESLYPDLGSAVSDGQYAYNSPHLHVIPVDAHIALSLEEQRKSPTVRYLYETRAEQIARINLLRTFCLEGVIHLNSTSRLRDDSPESYELVAQVRAP